ncbi:MAG: hypothetical protein U0836_07925 [Pirellulales bacterium]
MTRSAWFVAWAAVWIAANCADARADLLALVATGSFGPTSTLDGVPFGDDTPYSFRAVFDADHDRNPKAGEGAGYFLVTEFSISIAGHGDFAGIPNNDLNVALLDPSYHLHINAAGLLTVLGDPFLLDSYGAVDPAFDPHMPTPATFENYLTTLSGGAYVIPLSGGGELAIKDAGSRPRTAQLVSVPEPATHWLAGTAIGGLILCRLLALAFGKRALRLGDL